MLSCWYGDYYVLVWYDDNGVLMWYDDDGADGSVHHCSAFSK